MSYPMVCEIFSAPNSPFGFPVIPERWWRKEEEERQLRSVLLFKQTLLLFIKKYDISWHNSAI